MSKNKIHRLKNRAICSKVMLGISFILFSVAIPLVQNKITSTVETRHKYELNVLNAQEQAGESVLYSEMFNALTILWEKTDSAGNSLKDALDEIRNRFYLRSVKNYAESIFLLTEEVESDTLNNQRLKELYGKSIEELNVLNNQAVSYAFEYSGHFTHRVNRLERIKIFLYALATAGYISGLVLELFKKKNAISNK